MNNNTSIYNDNRNIHLGSCGGPSLNMIRKHIDMKNMYEFYIPASQKPYLQMLSKSIYRGIMTDIYGEFVIQGKKH